MSMLAAQCDRLRNVAAQIDSRQPIIAALIRDAADTIWELRNDCISLTEERNKLMNENIGLRAMLEWYE